nr:hypothetical protein [Tanacetum cinerariifolium]
LRRSGRNKDKEVYDSDHAKTVASGSKGKAKKQGRKRSRETSMSEEEKKLKLNQKACLEEIRFGGIVEFKVDGIPSKLGLYVDNFDENKMEIKLSKGSIVLIKDMIGVRLGLKNKGLDILEVNLKQMCYVDDIKRNDNIVYRRRPPTKAWIAKLLSEKEAKELNCEGFGHEELEEDFVVEEEQKGLEKMLTAAKHMFPGNINFIGFADKYINSLKCSSGGNNSRTNATMPETQEKENVIQGEASCPNINTVETVNDVGFRAQRNKEVKVSVSDIGVNEQTPCSGKDLMGLTKNRFADVGHDGGSLFGFDRQDNMCWVLTQKAFESVADEVERSIEKSKIMEIDDRPSFSFGVTQYFDVIPVTNNEKTVLTPMPISAYTPKDEACDVFMFHEKRVTTKSNIMRSLFYSRVADDDAALSSEESKHADFGRYVYGLDHIKSRNMTTAELEIGEYDWQTAMKQLAVLCKKYAATILMSDCNVLKEQVKAHIEIASG